MGEVTLYPDDQRDMIRGYLAAEHVIAETDPFRRRWIELVRACLHREELALGCALITLIGLRGIGMEAHAAGVLMGLTIDRPKGGGPCPESN